ncbi:metal-dependent hydrolase [Halococcus hamelinensis]|nr:metal-dependent hydrolase [Halococcus hamelinensis]
MWPWGHLAFGYVLCSMYSRLVYRKPPDGIAVLAIVLGTQLPDLVDKPLAWTFHVLPSGRSLAHSVFAAVLASVVVWAYCRRRGRSDLGAAFAIGYVSHLVADGYTYLFTGEYVYLSYLGWPLLPPPPFGDEGTFLTHLQNITLSPGFALQLVMAVVVYVVWIEDGAPGRAAFGAVLERIRSSS